MFADDGLSRVQTPLLSHPPQQLNIEPPFMFPRQEYVPLNMMIPASNELMLNHSHTDHADTK